MFADTATIEIRAGKGGDGRSSFLHEKYRAMGGPDGGDGGHGGNVIFQADHNANTLSRFRTTRRITAGDGEPGGGNRKRGAAGEDVTVLVPTGTQLWDGETLLADLTENGQSAIIARGGRGGFGNAHFQSSTRQAPKAAELGERGESYVLKLELKLVADVGLIGLPNAGKSTLLSVISNAKPAVGDYAFTTLVPNLGVTDHRDFTFLVADIPGLIEGASEGKGLGDEFLRHVERTSVLVHLVDAASNDIAADWRTVQDELSRYVVDLTDRPQLVAVSKAETVDAEVLEAAKRALGEASGQPVYVISAQAHQGLESLLDAAVVEVRAARERRALAALEAELPVIDETGMPDAWRVEPDGDGRWRVTGGRIEGFARRTNFESEDGVIRLRDILAKMGITRELRRQGVQPDDLVMIGESELSW